jgi:pyrophosphatase PpaX
MTEPISAVLFDWDGTLLDSRAALLAAWHDSTQEVLGRHFPVTAADEHEVFTLPGSAIWPRLAADAAQLTALVETFQRCYELTGKLVQPLPGVRQAVDRLRSSGVAVAVVTSKARRRFSLDARRAGLEGLIDASVCDGEAAAPKPDPSPVLVALGLLGVPAHNALMVGDTAVDVTAGLRADVAVAGALWGAGTEDELRRAGADTVLADPEELVALVLCSGVVS